MNTDIIKSSFYRGPRKDNLLISFVRGLNELFKKNTYRTHALNDAHWDMI